MTVRADRLLLLFLPAFYGFLTVLRWKVSVVFTILLTCSLRVQLVLDTSEILCTICVWVKWFCPSFQKETFNFNCDGNYTGAEFSCNSLPTCLIWFTNKSINFYNNASMFSGVISFCLTYYHCSLYLQYIP